MNVANVGDYKLVSGGTYLPPLLANLVKKGGYNQREKQG